MVKRTRRTTRKTRSTRKTKKKTSSDYPKQYTAKLSRKDKKREIITFISSDTNFIGRESKILKDEVEHDILKIGSSIKFCKLAEGVADIYPRFGRTMEWDTAAGHAILKYAGGTIIDLKTKKELIYGKKNYEN